MLNVCEQFKSIQGESTFAGIPCSFIRLSGCNLHCSYCDTASAVTEPGTPRPLDAVLSVVEGHGCRVVEVTGGEPLLQEETPELCRRLLDKGYTVLVETNGSLDIARLPRGPRGCVCVVDVKCPLSGMVDSFYEKNLDSLKMSDQLKFVLSGKIDFDWALTFVVSRKLHERCEVIFAPAQGNCIPRDLAEWILDAKAPVRLGLQLHYYIWGRDSKGH
jgi:7-carboxy-7-deazaguanine synthase